MVEFVDHDVVKTSAVELPEVRKSTQCGDGREEHVGLGGFL